MDAIYFFGVLEFGDIWISLTSQFIIPVFITTRLHVGLMESGYISGGLYVL